MALTTGRAHRTRYSEISEYVVKTVRETFGRHLNDGGRDDVTEHALAWLKTRRLITVDRDRDTWSTTAELYHLTR